VTEEIRGKGLEFLNFGVARSVGAFKQAMHKMAGMLEKRECIQQDVFLKSLHGSCINIAALRSALDSDLAWLRVVANNIELDPDFPIIKSPRFSS